jgi:type VI protein secretion system component Hcp
MRRRFATVLALVLLAVPAFADQIFLQLPGYKGPSTAAGRGGWYDVDSVSECQDNTGKASLCDIDLSKAQDETTAKLLAERLLVGKTLGSGPTVFEFCRTPGAAPYYRISLKNARFGSRSSSAGSNHPTESWTLSFQTIKWETWSVDGNGDPTGAPIIGCWDLASMTTDCGGL